ncbi:N(2)-acetyl-L-2,4-diaminobutanoate deacetylase DoeB [Limibacillus halophilus]|uniref:N-alpha-acetyl-L-2,4-diaminobutyrate deacetylase n=1 Tax=Limibacillus halophilus TaxID=1579333 RepID=A0A839SMZ9_9PROT|nr:N(2)-acetyl-L-2,4-diaminobutanoate deacetylase DoeB [Limibacillus halophilus]MBB3063822.1 N-alpha-acetyl-L-2,4-diaminobutyrate deacetylase [Limibacillus halophilus]
MTSVSGMLRRNPIVPTVEFEKDGIFHGHLKLPYSRDDSAWGSIMIPITVIKNGEGPTALLTGGNHGDEYEGPVALFNLSHSLDLDEVSGRIIIVPAMNYPAFRSNRRTSPIDNGNLNRTFPGRPDGTVTEKIADFFQRTLLPMADYVLDIHSGGKTLDFIPFAATHLLEDKDQQARCKAAMEAFSAPYSMLLLEIDAVGMYDTAAEEMGKVFVSTELGGGGSTTAKSVGIAKRGVRNLLIHAGIVEGVEERCESVLLDMPGEDCYITSGSAGLIEYSVDLGGEVVKGDLIARVHDYERTGRAPIEYRAFRDGVLAGRHYPGTIQMGDVVAVVAARV